MLQDAQTAGYNKSGSHQSGEHILNEGEKARTSRKSESSKSILELQRQLVEPDPAIMHLA